MVLPRKSLRRTVWLFVLPACIAVACTSGPRGWQAAQVAERQTVPLHAPTQAERARAPVLTQPPAGSGAPADTLPAAPGNAAGPGWTVRVHTGWLLALAAACVAVGYSLHAWQCGGVQMAQPGSSAPGTPRPSYGAASKELRLRERQAAAANEAAARPGVLDRPAAAPQAASVVAAGSAAGAGPFLQAARSACEPAQRGAENASEVAPDSEDAHVGAAQKEHAAVAAAAFLAGDPLSLDSSPDEPRSSTLPAVPLALSPAPACGTSGNPPSEEDAGRVASASAASSPGTGVAEEPSGGRRARGWSEGAAGLRRRRAPSTEGPLWEEAAGLVANLASRFGVAPGELAAGERVALIGVVLQTWHALQQDADAREAAWQRERANELRAASAVAAASAAATKARNAAAAAAEARLRRFRAALGDSLPFGVAVMLGTFAAGAARLGLLAPLLLRCRPLAALGPLTPRRPWALLEAAGVVACWAGAAGDLAAAAACLLAGAWLVARAGLLAGEPHGRPLVRIALGLGCGAGAAGYMAVARMGGDAPAWLAAWEAWLSLHLLAAWAAPAALAWAPPLLGGKAGWALGAAGVAVYHAGMALVLPALVGVAPFHGRLGPLELLSHGLRRWLWA